MMLNATLLQRGKIGLRTMRLAAILSHFCGRGGFVFRTGCIVLDPAAKGSSSVRGPYFIGPAEHMEAIAHASLAEGGCGNVPLASRRLCHGESADTV
jgi:hypothetical protein